MRYETETIYLDVCGKELEYIVVFSYYAGEPASEDGPGEPEELEVEGLYRVDTHFKSLRYETFHADRPEILEHIGRVSQDLADALRDATHKALEAIKEAK